MPVTESDILAIAEVSRSPYGMVDPSDKAVLDRTLLNEVFDRLEMGMETRVDLFRRSRRHGSTLAEEIVASRLTTERNLSDAIAHVLGLVAEDPTPAVTITRDARGLRRSGFAYLIGSTSDCTTRVFVAPDLLRLGEIARALPVTDAERDRVRVATSSALASATAADDCRQRSEAARLSLAADLNRWSARQVLTAFQGAVLALLLTGIAVATLLLGAGTWFWSHLLCTVVALTCTTFRLIVLVGSRRPSEVRLASARSASEAGLPFYSVLVALHREADIVHETVQAMAELDWPASRLEVLFVCEATDPETIAAVERAIGPYPHFVLVVTPASRPTTKPKALNFALPVTRGEFVVLFDAEDRPHPQQLREAYARFSAGDETLACLQAPLVVTNGASGWRQAHFAMEYAILFRLLLPWLAERSLPLPLGGTSNHFRREHLVSVGGWDSHNVAEDADLGIRLARLGFTTSVLRHPTYETSTTRWLDWRNQRTRWMKGWVQTWLVHMRDPVTTTRQLGLRGMLAFQIVFVGMLASGITHLLLVLQLVLATLMWRLGSALVPDHAWLAVADGISLALAYVVFAKSFDRVATPREISLRRHVVSLWAYWLIVSYAALRGVWQLAYAPHLWEKTPHAPRGRSRIAARTVETYVR